MNDFPENDDDLVLGDDPAEPPRVSRIDADLYIDYGYDEPPRNLPENDANLIYYDDYDEPRRYWTRHRILLLIFAVIILITMFAYIYSGLFLPPPPPPTVVPGSLI